MNTFPQKVTKYISENPNVIAVILIALIILVIWLYLKSKNMFSNLTIKKNKLKDEKEKNAEEKNTKESNTEEKNTKKMHDPEINKLLKEINK